MTSRQLTLAALLATGLAMPNPGLAQRRSALPTRSTTIALFRKDTIDGTTATFDSDTDRFIDALTP